MPRSGASRVLGRCRKCAQRWVDWICLRTCVCTYKVTWHGQVMGQVRVGEWPEATTPPVWIRIWRVLREPILRSRLIAEDTNISIKTFLIYSWSMSQLVTSRDSVDCGWHLPYILSGNYTCQESALNCKTPWTELAVRRIKPQTIVLKGETPFIQELDSKSPSRTRQLWVVLFIS